MNSISIMRFCYLIEVCAYHLVMTIVNNRQILTISPSTNEFFKGLLIFQTYYKPAFMLSFISGYLFFLNVNNKNYKEKIKEKIIKRLHSVLVPLLLWNSILFVVLNVIKLSIVRNTNILIIEQPSGVSLSNFLESFVNPPFGLWFFQNLVIFFLLSPLIYIIFRDKRTTYIFLVCFIFISIFDFFPSFVYKKFIFSFLLGAYISIKGIDFKDIELKYYYVILLLLFIMSLLFCKHYYENYVYRQIIVLLEDIVLLTTNIVVFIILKPLLFKISNINKIALLMNKFSKASFYIFIFHISLLSVIVKVIFPKIIKLYPPNILFDIILFSFTLLLVFLVCFLLNKVSMKFKNIHALLTGSR